MADLDRMQLLQQEEGDIQSRIACLRRRLDINRKMQAEILDAVPLQPAVVPVTRPKAFVPFARAMPVQPKPEVSAKIKTEIKTEILTKAAIVKTPPQLRPPPLEVKQAEIVKQEPEEPRQSKSLPHLGDDVDGGADVRLRDAARLSSPQSPARVRIIVGRRGSGEPVPLRVLCPEEASQPRPSKTSKRLSPSPPPVEKARPRQPHPPRGPPPAELVQAAKTMSTTSKSSGLGQPRPSSTPTGATTMAPGTSEEEDVEQWLDEDTSW